MRSDISVFSCITLLLLSIGEHPVMYSTWLFVLLVVVYEMH